MATIAVRASSPGIATNMPSGRPVAESGELRAKASFVGFFERGPKDEERSGVGRVSPHRDRSVTVGERLLNLCRAGRENPRVWLSQTPPAHAQFGESPLSSS